MDSNRIRQAFLSFFESKGHKIIPSSSLIPDDPSVLLTTAGMQQFKKYFTGELNAERDFGTKNVCSVQKCFRTSDIDEVGDESHLTFFEMLGNFSFGGYWKKEAIEYAHEFITKELGLVIDFVSVFEGNNEVPADLESEEIWKSLGLKDVRKFGREDNFWGPTGSEGPCGSTTEIYIKTAEGKSVEIWNLVFNEFYCDKNKKLSPLEIKSIDTGMGFERLAMAVQKVPTIFETDLFSRFRHHSDDDRKDRIVADHARAVSFLIFDGVRPSNKGAGYVLRRLLRRLIFYLSNIGRHSETQWFNQIYNGIEDTYHFVYPNSIPEMNTVVSAVFEEEYAKFNKTLRIGIKELKKIKIVDAYSAFKIYESYGLPYEIIKEVGVEKAKNLTREDFDKEFEKHQEISRAGAEKKFGGHGLILDTGELKAGSKEEEQKVIRLHTATHLLHQALRDVLGSEVSQCGSDITSERARFDFVFPRKMTEKEIKEAENIVNGKIKESLPVNFREMPKGEAEKSGALKFFKGNYPDAVKVYYVGDSLESAYSKEFCGGPHVSNTEEIGNFKIIKEESSSAGIRRIKAIVS
jgi:alanyl-tRNA synthetase